METYNTTAVIPACDIDHLLGVRDRVKELAEIISKAGHELESLGGYLPRSGGVINNGCKWDCGHELKEWERDRWSKLLDQSGLKDFMDAVARAQWDKQYYANDFPPFTAENISAAFDGIHADRGMMVSRGVQELFARLSNDHVTNKPNQFTNKIILLWVCETWGRGYRSIRHGGNVDLIDDLSRTIHICRGIPAPAGYEQRAYSVLGEACKQGKDTVAEFPFFTVRMYYGKGTAHVVFRHDEDVKRLNAMLSMATGGMQVPNNHRK